MQGEKKTVRVVAALICRTENGREMVLATQRGYGEWKDYWEFPGGKTEPGETPEEALRREILEELDAHITVDSFLTKVEYDYPKFHLSMDCFLCRLEESSYLLKEHEAARWLLREQLGDVNWLPADVIAVAAYRDRRTDMDPADKETGED